jgi:hypothetical protein
MRPMSIQPAQNSVGHAAMRVGRFVLHFMEMCLVMCVGGIGILTGLFLFSAGRLGYPDFRRESPGLMLIVVAVALTLAMVVWMRIRGHDWRLTLEMAAPTVGLAAVFLVLGAVGVMPFLDVGAFCGLACVFMLVPMLFRLDMYSGGHQHGQTIPHPRPS